MCHQSRLFLLPLFHYLPWLKKSGIGPVTLIRLTQETLLLTQTIIYATYIYNYSVGLPTHGNHYTSTSVWYGLYS